MALPNLYEAVNTYKTFNNVLSILAWDIPAIHFVHGVMSSRRQGHEKVHIKNTSSYIIILHPTCV